MSVMNNAERALSIIEVCLSESREVRFVVPYGGHKMAQVASDLARAGVLVLTYRKLHDNGDVSVAYRLDPTWEHYLLLKGKGNEVG